MNKTILFTALICFQSAFSQVSLEKNRLVKDGVKYKFSKYEEVFQNKEALEHFKKARTNNTVGSVFAFAGGFTAGFGIAQVLQGKNKQVIINGQSQTVKVEKAKGGGALIGIGVGLIGIGIPFAIASKKNTDKAIALENGESTAFQPYFKLESAGNGMALSYNF